MALTLAKLDEMVRCDATFINLLAKMLNYDSTKRPTVAQILVSPFFQQLGSTKQPLVPPPCPCLASEAPAKRIRLVFETQSPSIAAPVAASSNSEDSFQQELQDKTSMIVPITTSSNSEDSTQQELQDKASMIVPITTSSNSEDSIQQESQDKTSTAAPVTTSSVSEDSIQQELQDKLDEMDIE